MYAIRSYYEPFHTERRSNGVRVYIGSADISLPPGEHEYRLLYRTTRQLGFFDGFDELYWNVTGNGWAFPIDRARARIALPQDVAFGDIRSAWYTGAQGSEGTDAGFRVTGSRTFEFTTIRSYNFV